MATVEIVQTPKRWKAVCSCGWSSGCFQLQDRATTTAIFHLALRHKEDPTGRMRLARNAFA